MTAAAGFDWVNAAACGGKVLGSFGRKREAPFAGG
jgi:hypothetical protein